MFDLCCHFLPPQSRCHSILFLYLRFENPAPTPPGPAPPPPHSPFLRPCPIPPTLPSQVATHVYAAHHCSLAGQLHCCIAGHFRFTAGNSSLTAHAEHYGFALADNPHDQAEIPLTALPESFTAYLTQQGRTPGQCFLHCNGIPGWTLLRDLRCYAAKPSERKQLGHLAVSGERISIAGDMKVSVQYIVCAIEGFIQSSSMSPLQ